MPPDQNQQHPRRPHYHRGRRGPDRRGDRRPQQQSQPQQQGENTTSNRDQLDVEQIMREIRSRISEKHGIDLTTQQIQELAARRLEAILDPRAIKPSLMDELRRAAGLPADTAPSEPEDAAIDEAALYASQSGFLNSLRRLFNLLNPKAIVDALNGQSRKIKAVAAREAELRRRQTEWNALHFEILRRLVTDIARAEIDKQHLAHRVESLQARVDFNERRVRGLEHSQQQQQHQPQHQPKPASRPPSESAPPPSAATPLRSDETGSTEHGPAPEGSGEGRRRRRRRRGRRSGQPRDITGTPVAGMAAPGALDQSDQGAEGDDFGDDDAGADDLGDDLMAATPEAPISVLSESETAPFEPPPSPPEEPVHVAHSEQDHSPAPPEVTSTPDAVAPAEGSDPLTREQS